MYVCKSVCMLVCMHVCMSIQSLHMFIWSPSPSLCIAGDPRQFRVYLFGHMTRSTLINFTKQTTSSALCSYRGAALGAGLQGSADSIFKYFGNGPTQPTLHCLQFTWSLYLDAGQSTVIQIEPYQRCLCVSVCPQFSRQSFIRTTSHLLYCSDPRKCCVDWVVVWMSGSQESLAFFDGISQQITVFKIELPRPLRSGERSIHRVQPLLPVHSRLLPLSGKDQFSGLTSQAQFKELVGRQSQKDGPHVSPALLSTF